MYCVPTNIKPGYGPEKSINQMQFILTGGTWKMGKIFCNLQCHWKLQQTY